jgi:aspartyl-tRNA(Asn)/glutamyl-tRNA(Gln) amidotransferase subunit A
VLDDELVQRSAVELSGLIGTRQISPVELAEAFLARAHRLARLNAYITLDEAGALAAARAAEREIASGTRRGPLHGLPIAIKDLMDVRGLRTTLGSAIVDYVADEDAAPVARLRAAGAVFLGKLNLSEFALGGNVTHPFGVPRNPWDETRQAGQSSSGSGVAVAASLCAAALGSDTAGSVRSPAAFCGIVGLRPTWGRVGRTRVFPLTWFMDAVGPMTKTVADAALVFEGMAGQDPGDRYSSRRPVDPFRPSEELRGVRVGLVRESVGEGTAQPPIEAAVREALRVMEQAGATVVEVSLPLFRDGGLISNSIVEVEAAHIHRRWLRERPQDYDFASRRRLLAASLIPGALYAKALRLGTLMRRDVLAALDAADVLVTPTQADVPPTIATETGLTSKEAVMRQFFGIRAHRGPFNLAGVPAMAVPCGFTAAGLPISMQLVGRPFAETTVFQAGHVYQQRTEWHLRRPPVQ